MPQCSEAYKNTILHFLFYKKKYKKNFAPILMNIFFHISENYKKMKKKIREFFS